MTIAKFESREFDTVRRLMEERQREIAQVCTELERATNGVTFALAARLQALLDEQEADVETFHQLVEEMR